MDPHYPDTLGIKTILKTKLIQEGLSILAMFQHRDYGINQFS